MTDEERQQIYEKWKKTGLLDTVTAESMRNLSFITRPLVEAALGALGIEASDEWEYTEARVEEARVTMAIMLDNTARAMSGEEIEQERVKRTQEDMVRTVIPMRSEED
jgi:predicted thioredoxin/glutaredoxin